MKNAGVCKTNSDNIMVTGIDYDELTSTKTYKGQYNFVKYFVNKYSFLLDNS